MEVSIKNLILFFKENYKEHSNNDITTNTVIRTDFSFNIDGDDAVYLLSRLEKEFKVSFDEIFFNKYFFNESEIFNSLSWFGIKKTRVIDKELTIGDLLIYMQSASKKESESK